VVPTILYVDDVEQFHLLFTQVAKTVLGEVTVVSVYDGEQGISKYNTLRAEGAPLKVVFTDYNMPNKNGGQLIKEIREKDKDLAIYLCSADLGAVPLEELQMATGLLDKPFNKQELEAILRAHCNGQ